MSSMSELRQRLHAIEQTRQITNAMYLLSTSRMKKAMQNIDYNLYYMRRLRATVKDILSKTKHSELHNRFIEQQFEGNRLYIVVTADKGMCGEYNSDIVNLAMEKIKDDTDPIIASLGSVGNDMFIKAGIEPDFMWYDVLQHPSIHTSEIIANTLIELYIKHSVNEAYVIYTEYESSAVQRAVCKRLLPLLRRDFLDLDYEYNYKAQMIFEPTVDEFFLKMVPQYVTGFMYDVFMQSAASENAARMAAMQSATENADKMIVSLSAEINAVRQLAITNEIIEIAAASETPGAV